MMRVSTISRPKSAVRRGFAEVALDALTLAVDRFYVVCEDLLFEHRVGDNDRRLGAWCEEALYY